MPLGYSCGFFSNIKNAASSKKNSHNKFIQRYKIYPNINDLVSFLESIEAFLDEQISFLSENKFTFDTLIVCEVSVFCISIPKAPDRDFTKAEYCQYPCKL
jgi:hypothetical protein